MEGTVHRIVSIQGKSEYLRQEGEGLASVQFREDRCPEGEGLSSVQFREDLCPEGEGLSSVQFREYQEPQELHESVHLLVRLKVYQVANYCQCISVPT